MPPWTIGCSTPTSSVKRVLIMLVLCFLAVSVVRNIAHALFSRNRMPSGPAKVYRAGAVGPCGNAGREGAAGPYRAVDRRGLQSKAARVKPRAQAALAAGFVP